MDCDNIKAIVDSIGQTLTIISMLAVAGIFIWKAFSIGD